MRVTFTSEHRSFAITGWQAAMWMAAGAAFFFAVPVVMAVAR